MANKVNNWKELLKLANKDLKAYGCQISVYKTEDSEDFWQVDIDVIGMPTDCFAENYNEDELSECINDAWAHAKAKVKPQMAYRVTAYYDVELGCEPEILIEIYETEELAKARVAQLIKQWKDGWKRTEDDADDWTEKDDSLEAYKDSEWNVDIFWMPEPIRNKIV